MKTLKKLLWLAAVLLCIVSCSKEEVTEKVIEVPEGKVLVETEIVVDGVIQSKTRASSEAGYTTGDGLYDSGDKVIVAAVANDGYELAAFYDKKYPSTNLGTSYEFPAAEPRTFKAEFARKYTITVSASPTAGGTVSGGGTYRSGKPCTLTATPNAGYTFDGWYEGSTKLSSNTSYSFTVSSNRTITGKFIEKITDYTLTLTWVEQYSGGQGFSSWNYFVRVAVNPSANVSVIVNGKDDNTRVGFPLTIKNDGNKYYYYEANEDSDNEGNVIYYTSSTISDFSIIINDVCIVSNESINSSDFPVKLNGKNYSEGNIRCLIKAIRSNN